MINIDEKEFEEKCDEIVHFWKLPKMAMMVMEEAGEFIQAVSKFERALEWVPNKTKEENHERYLKARKNLIDEIGDMYISLMVTRRMYEAEEMEEEIEQRIKDKLSKEY